MAYDVKSVNTTLCYLRRGEDYLMLHRVKKQNDVNQDKWIGVGGKFEARMSGSLMRARAMATRCIWPPDIWFGRLCS